MISMWAKDEAKAVANPTMIGGVSDIIAIGTVIGNPWTFPFIWLWIFELGNWILGTSSALTTADITMGFLWHHPWEVLMPMLIGSIPTALVTWFAFFWPIRRMVASYQSHRRHRLAQAASAYRDRQVTGSEAAE